MPLTDYNFDDYISSRLHPKGSEGQLLDVARMAALLRTPRPTEENPDYDMPGYVKAYGPLDQSHGEHGSDEYKLPNHITFSNQSRYADPNLLQGGDWRRGGAALWSFTPSEYNLEQYSPNQYARYFANQERKGTFVTLPDGRRIEGTR